MRREKANHLKRLDTEWTYRVDTQSEIFFTKEGKIT